MAPISRYLAKFGVLLGGIYASSMYISSKNIYDKWKDKLNSLTTYKDKFKFIMNSYLPTFKGGYNIIDKVNPNIIAQATDLLENNEEVSVSGIDDLTKEQLKERLEQVLGEIIDIQKNYNIKLQKFENENEELRKEIVNILAKNPRNSKLKRQTLVEMYGNILDTLSDFDKAFGTKECLPRVVVVGDQSSGKTSVLELITKARIFPRGSGEMMTRAPVMVTMGEGPKHVASFRNGTKEYNLLSDADVAEIRSEIEKRMIASVKIGQTITNEVISLSLRGPGIPRMVLVDLPGIINTVTSDMSADAKDSIINMAKSYMSNPNSIILCVQDGSVDAERSLVTDLVSSIDPNGARTLCVLTKLDIAERNNIRIERIQKLLSGKLFQMKAMNYFAVISGTGNPNSTISEISSYEEEFFKKSSLFLNGTIKPSQATSKNLVHSISQCFWDMVRSSVEREAEALRLRQFALEAEWRHNYPNMRELDRDELFEKARADILEDTISFSNIPPSQWEDSLSKALWSKFMPYIFRNIYLPNALTSSKIGFQTQVEILLQKWVENEVAKQSIEIGKEVMLEKLLSCFERNHPQYEGNTYKELFKNIRKRLIDTSKSDFNWSELNAQYLEIIQKASLGDIPVNNRSEWEQACSFMEGILSADESRITADLEKLKGPSPIQQWLWWAHQTPENILNKKVMEELNKLNEHRDIKSPYLSQIEISTVLQSLNNQGISANQNIIHSIWENIFLLNYYKSAIDGIHYCRKNFRQQDFSQHCLGCQDVVLFFKVNKLLQQTINTIRQQINSQESRRMEKFIKNILEDDSVNDKIKHELFQGKQVDLATEIKQVIQVRTSLEQFIQALHRENNIL